MLKTSRS